MCLEEQWKTQPSNFKELSHETAALATQNYNQARGIITWKQQEKHSYLRKSRKTHIRNQNLVCLTFSDLSKQMLKAAQK